MSSARLAVVTNLFPAAARVVNEPAGGGRVSESGSASTGVGSPSVCRGYIGLLMCHPRQSETNPLALLRGFLYFEKGSRAGRGHRQVEFDPDLVGLVVSLRFADPMLTQWAVQ
jgi:hypothetical protein